MSFFDEIKTEIQTEQNQKSNLAEQMSAAQAPQAASEPAPTAPVLPERMPEFVQEELKTLQETIRQDARSGKYQTVGGKHLFDGTRLWHEGDYRQVTALLANFYPFLSRDRMQEKLLKLREMRKVARDMGLDLAVYDMTVDRNYVGRPASWSDPGRPAGD